MDQGAQADQSLRELFDRWGLDIGGVVGGWRIDSLQLGNQGTAAMVDLSRDADQIRVRLRPAGDAPRFARVREIDLAHDTVDPSLSHAAGALLKAIVVELRPRNLGPLAALLRGERAAPQPVTAPAGQPYVVIPDAPPLDPAKRAPPDRPVLQFEHIDVEDVHRYPDALREIFRGERGGLVIRGVYSKEEMARVVDRLSSAHSSFPLMHLPAAQRSYFLGLCLEGGDPTLASYLEAAEQFRRETLPVFEGMEPFEPRVERLFRSLGGGREIELARFTDGRAYTPATIRILPDGGQLAPHCGNEMYARPSYEHLNSFVDNHDQLSYFLTLQEAEEGGGLIIYSLKWSEVDADHILPDRRSNVGSLLGTAEWMEVRPSAGDVLIFDGGRYLHRVDWVRGRTRWTMGGFLMFDRSGDKILYFA